MFKAIARFFRAIGYLFIGKTDNASEKIETNPIAIKAKFDAIAKEKTRSIRQFKDATGTLVAQEEKKKAKLKQVSKEIDEYKNLNKGAAAKAKMRVEELKRANPEITKEEIQTDEEYRKCLAAYNDFSSTLAEKETRARELEEDIRDYSKKVSDHKIQLQTLIRELDNLKAESADTIADLISAQEAKEINDMLAGITQSDSMSEDLQNIRDMREKVKADAKVSREIAGTDSKSQKIEFMNYARTSATNDEFDSLIGLADDEPKTVEAPEKTQRENLPE